jgi:hypothetical protein
LKASRFPNIYTFGITQQSKKAIYKISFCDQFDFLPDYASGRTVELPKLQNIVSFLLPAQVNVGFFSDKYPDLQEAADVFASLNGKLPILVESDNYPDILAKFCLRFCNYIFKFPVLLNALGPKLRKLKCNAKLLLDDEILPMELDLYDVGSNVTFGELNFS